MSTRQNQKSGRMMWVLASLAVVVCAVAGALYNNKASRAINSLRKPYQPKPQLELSPQKKAELGKRIISEMNSSLGRMRQKNNLAGQEAIKAIEMGSEASFKRAERGVDKVVDELASFKGCAALCYYMAYDKIQGTNKQRTHIQSLVKKEIGQHVVASLSESENRFQKLISSLNENRAQLGVDLAVKMNQIIPAENKLALRTFKDFHGKISGLSNDGFQPIALATTSSLAGGVADIVFIKTTIECAKVVLGPIARKVGFGAAASLIGANLDGPLPIMDCVVLVLDAGGSILCAYDLYNAQIILKKKLRSALRKEVVKTHQNFMWKMREHVRETVEEYNKANANEIESLKKTLQKGEAK